MWRPHAIALDSALTGPIPVEGPTVIGVDDWARRRKHRYGTIVCVLERRRAWSTLAAVSPSYENLADMVRNYATKSSFFNFGPKKH
jgi:hypothetical protein